MGNLNLQYGTNGQAITITLASLANAGARASTVVDNTSNEFIDALVEVSVKSNASGTSASGHVDVYVYATVDNGTTYTEAATGSDAGITLTVPTNAKLIGIINVVANAVTYNGGPFSVAAAFGGSLPAKWGIIVVNNSGAALDATEGNHSKKYQGVYGLY